MSGQLEKAEVLTRRSGEELTLERNLITGGEYDAVIDFDEIMRDPGVPTQFLQSHISGDSYHLNDAG